MDELIEVLEPYEDVQFLVSLDYSSNDADLYSCNQWAELYTELGEYDNNPLILDTDPDHYIWNMFAGSTYSSYAIIDHNMVVRYLFDEPDLDNFQNIYLPGLVDEMYGCADLDAINYDSNSVYDNNSCIYSDINEDGNTDINDIIFLLNMILDSELEESADLNNDQNVDILDIIQLVNIILDN